MTVLLLAVFALVLAGTVVAFLVALFLGDDEEQASRARQADWDVITKRTEAERGHQAQEAMSGHRHDEAS